MPREIADEEYKIFMNWLKTMDPRVLDHEHFDTQLAEGLVRVTRVSPIHPEGVNIPSILNENAKDTAKYFSQNNPTA